MAEIGREIGLDAALARLGNQLGDANKVTDQAYPTFVNGEKGHAENVEHKLA
jgi:hypothetical protein